METPTDQSTEGDKADHQLPTLQPAEVIDLTSDSPVMAPVFPDDDTQVTIKQEDIQPMELDRPMANREDSAIDENSNEQAQSPSQETDSPTESQSKQGEQPVSEQKVKQEGIADKTPRTMQPNTPSAHHVTIDLTGLEDGDEDAQQSANQADETHNHKSIDHTDTSTQEQSTIDGDVIMTGTLQDTSAISSAQDQEAGFLNDQRVLGHLDPTSELPTLTREAPNPTTAVEPKGSENDIEMPIARGEQPKRKRATNHIGFLANDTSDDDSDDDSDDSTQNNDPELDVDPDDGGEAKFNEDWEAHQASVTEEHELQADYNEGYVSESVLEELNQIRQKNKSEAKRLGCEGDPADPENGVAVQTDPIQPAHADSNEDLFMRDEPHESRAESEAADSESEEEESNDELDNDDDTFQPDPSSGEEDDTSELRRAKRPKKRHVATDEDDSTGRFKPYTNDPSNALFVENLQRSLQRLKAIREALELKTDLNPQENVELESVQQKITEMRKKLADLTSNSTPSEGKNQRFRPARNTGPRARTSKEWHMRNMEKRQGVISNKRKLLHRTPSGPRMTASRRMQMQQDEGKGDNSLRLIITKLKCGNPLQARMTLSDLPDFEQVPGKTIDEKLKNIADRGAATADKGQIRKDQRTLRLAAQSFGLGNCKMLNGNSYQLKGMKSHLYPHQVIGTSKMLELEFGEDCGGIMADEMGMGKTVQTLACVVSNRPSPEDIQEGRKTTLIVVPSSAITQWIREIETHPEDDYPMGVLHYKASTRMGLKSLQKQDIIVVSYSEVLSSFFPPDVYREYKSTTSDQKLRNLEDKHLGVLYDLKFWRVVLDEAHAIKNHLSQTANACRFLDAKHRWALTGTPLHNNLEEFRSYLEFLGVNWTPTHERFKALIHNQKIPGNRQQFEEMVSTIVIRRTMDHTLMGHRLYTIPEPFTDINRITLSKEEQIIYRTVESKVRNAINRQTKQRQSGCRKARKKELELYLVYLLRLRQAVAHPFLLEGAIGTMIKEKDLKQIRRGLQNIGGQKTVLEQIEVWRRQKHREQGSAESQSRDPASFGSSQFGSMFNMDEHIDAALQEFEESDELVCQFCCSEATKPFKAACGHSFCEDCITSVLDTAQRADKGVAKCPLCDTPLKDFEPVGKPNNAGDLGSSISSDDDNDIDELLSQSRKSSKRAAKKKSKKGTKGLNEKVIFGRDGKKLGNDEYDVQPEPQTPSTFLTACDLKYPEPMVPSAKTTVVKETILKWQAEAPDDKIIIFTQFIQEGQILGRMLQAEGFPFLYYFGDMTVDQKDAAIEGFKTDPSIKVLVASLKSGGVALNLTCANRVILTDPWWNAAIELQAYGRVFRIGQTKPTYFQSILVDNTIDERMERLQMKKLRQIGQALKHSKGLDWEETVSLFGRLTTDDAGNQLVEADYHD